MGRRTFPLIEPLRGVAALSILVLHAGSLAHANNYGGWWDPVVGHLHAGVPIFFVLSGFLLYRPFAAARADATPRPSLGGYGLRRLARVVPAYWVALAVLAALPQITLSGDPLVYFAFLQAYSWDTVSGGIGPAWSLCVEVSFYALLPLYAVLARRRRWTPREELGVLATMAVASLLLAPIQQYSMTIAGTFAWFAAGMALAIVSVRRPAWTPSARDCWLAAAMVYAAVCILIPPFRSFHGAAGFDIAERAAFGVIALLVVAPALGWTAAPSSRLTQAGRISYGVFLWHCPLQLALADVVPPSFFAILSLSLLATLPVAAASWRWVEQPCLRLAARRIARGVRSDARTGVAATLRPRHAQPPG